MRWRSGYDALFIALPDEMCPAGNVETVRTKGPRSSHHDRTCGSIQCLFRPFLWTNWFGLSYIRKFRTFLWRSRPGSVTIEAARGAMAAEIHATVVRKLPSVHRLLTRK